MNTVAVIIPCFESGRTLREAVDSVRVQTHAVSELLVVDDGSVDLYTRQVLLQLETEGVRIHRLRHRGVAHARNAGAAETSAELLLYLDADDVLRPTFVEKTLDRLRERPELDLVATALEAFEGAHYTWCPPSGPWKQHLVRGSFPITTLMRRRVFDAVGGFDAALSAHEDWDFWLTALERGFAADVLPEPLLRYRVRAHSRYHHGIAPDAFVKAHARIAEKHAGTIEAMGLDVLEEKEAFYVEQQSYGEALEARRLATQREIADLDVELLRLRAELADRGLPPVDFGDLGSTQPLSPIWGLDRGKPFDRHYIENFLQRYAADIRGDVLEVKDPGYAMHFGGARLHSVGVLDIDPANARATLRADLSRADELPENHYDCFILTHTLHIIYDFRAALRNAVRVLKPGGVLLCTVPVISRVSFENGGIDGGDFWRFTEPALRRMLAELFPLDAFTLEVHGNVKAGTAFLQGCAPSDVAPSDLSTVDPFFPVTYCVRVVKPRATQRRGPREPSALVLAYHRIADHAVDPHGLCTSPSVFEEQCRLVKRHFQPIALETLAEALADGNVPDRAVALTFDDGYLDAWTTAAPILLRHGLPATFFVNTDRWDEEHEHWQDALDEVFLGDGPLPEVLGLEGFGTLPTRTRSQRLEGLRRLKEALWPANVEGRSRPLSDLFGKVGVRPARDSHRVLTRSEVQSLAALPGMRIGGHSVHHLQLVRQDVEVQRREVGEDKQTLESALSIPVRCFAYPYGEHTPELEQVVRRCGYPFAVTVESARVTAGTNPLRVPRYEVQAHTPKDFLAAAETLLDGAL